MIQKLLAVALFALLPSCAWAQTYPSGTFVPGHTIRCQNSTCTSFVDGGGAGGAAINGQGYLTELGVTATGTPVCVNDALTSANGGYHALCFGANALGGGLITYNAYKGASELPLQVQINGVTQEFGNGITELTGDVTAGPGNGTVPATVVAIGGHAVTLAGALTLSGAFATTLTVTGTTSVTLPTSGTLATTAAIPVSANPSATAGPTAVHGTALTFMTSDSAPAVQKGSSSQFGIVEVDGSTITASGGVISAVGSSGANPSATAGPAANNGSATTFMRSDASPAVQKGSSSQFGLVEVDNTTITATAGVITAVAGNGSGAIAGTTSPVFVTPTLGVANATSLNVTGNACPTNGLYLEASNTPAICANGSVVAEFPTSGYIQVNSGAGGIESTGATPIALTLTSGTSVSQAAFTQSNAGHTSQLLFENTGTGGSTVSAVNVETGSNQSYVVLSVADAGLATLATGSGTTGLLIETGTGPITISGLLSFNALSGAGAAAKYVCADSSGNVLIQSGTC